MQKILFATSILIASCQGIHVSQALLKQRGQLGWRQEVTNDFTWNATQELTWSVVNAFIDVQTSPEGDIYAIQKISSDVSDIKYHLYNFNITSNIWSLVDSSFQVKAVRFDRLGNIYYLDPENCVRNSQKVKLICGLSDFEVTVNKEIIGLHDGSSQLQTDTPSSAFKAALVEPFKYKAIAGYKGITLLQDQPILISNDGTVDSKYGGEKLVSISAGIDGSLWALLDEENVVDYQVLKWQTITQKWYKVEGGKGTSLSAYNEISVAIVDAKGLLSLSSQAGHQNEAEYTASAVQPVTNPPVSRPDITSFQSKLASFEDFKWLSTLVPGKNFSKFEQKLHTQFGVMTRSAAQITLANIPNLFMIYKTNYSVITGFYIEETLPETNQSIIIKPNSNVVFSLTSKKTFLPTKFNYTYYQNQMANQDHFLVVNDKAGLIFQPHCGTYDNGQALDAFFEVSENQQRVMSQTLTGNSNTDINSEYVACVEVEYYQGIL